MIAEERLMNFLHALARRRRQGSGRHKQVQPHEHHHTHQLYQLSTLNAIMEGAYDGNLRIDQLRQHGDFGLGTFNGLDGEMIVIDGHVYQALVNGGVQQVDDAAQTPFAVVQFFEPEWQVQIDEPLTFNALPQYLAQRLSSTNYFYALRVDGEMQSVRARSVARQQKLYRPLVEVIAEQNVFEFTDITGTLVGFRFPDYTQGINMPGWHLHFISTDRQHGGHVLDFTLARGEIAVEHTSDFFMELPESTDFAGADLAQILASKFRLRLYGSLGTMGIAMDI